MVDIDICIYTQVSIHCISFVSSEAALAPLGWGVPSIWTYENLGFLCIMPWAGDAEMIGQACRKP